MVKKIFKVGVYFNIVLTNSYYQEYKRALNKNRDAGKNVSMPRFFIGEEAEKINNGIKRVASEGRSMSVRLRRAISSKNDNSKDQLSIHEADFTSARESRLIMGSDD